MYSSRAFIWVVSPLVFVYKKSLFSNNTLECTHWELSGHTFNFTRKWTLFKNHLQGHTFKFLFLFLFLCFFVVVFVFKFCVLAARIVISKYFGTEEIHLSCDCWFMTDISDSSSLLANKWKNCDLWKDKKNASVTRLSHLSIVFRWILKMNVWQKKKVILR